MKYSKSKLLICLLAFVLIFSTLSIVSFAADETEEEIFLEDFGEDIPVVCADGVATVTAYKQVDYATDKVVDLKYFELIGTATDIEDAVSKITATGAPGGLIELSDGTLTVTNRQDINAANIIIKGAGKDRTTLTGNSTNFNNKTNGLQSSNLSSEYKAILGLGGENIKVMDLTVTAGNCGYAFITAKDLKTVRVNSGTSYFQNVAIQGQIVKTNLMIGTTKSVSTVHGVNLTVGSPKYITYGPAIEKVNGAILETYDSNLGGLVIGESATLGKGYYKLTYGSTVAYTTIPYAIEAYNDKTIGSFLSSALVNNNVEQGVTVAEAMTADLTTVLDGETTLLYGYDCDEMRALASEFREVLAELAAKKEIDVSTSLARLDAALAIEFWHGEIKNGECALCEKSGLVLPKEDVDVEIPEDVVVEGADTTDTTEIIDRVVVNNDSFKEVSGFDGAENNAVIEQMKSENPELANEAPKMEIKATNIVVSDGVVTKMTFDVTPMLGNVKITLGGEVTFRLPVDSRTTATTAAVFHEGELLGADYEILGDENGKYVEIVSKEFSEYSVDTAYVAPTSSITGSGTEADPFVISDLAGLKEFSENVAGGNSYGGQYVILASDIDLAEASDWAPIGTATAAFAGNFDGKNYVIKNLTSEGGDYVGLFGKMSGGSISNVKIENVNLKGVQYVGAIVGMGYTGEITNCHVYGSISIVGNYMVGGINGQGYAVISESSVIGNNASTDKIVGIHDGGSNEGDNVGGIVGHNGENNHITNCTVKNVTVSGTRKVAGIVGITSMHSKITGCSVENVVVETSATEAYANDNLKTMSIGGIVGQYQASGNGGSIADCNVSGLTFNNVNGVTVSAGVLTGGMRGTSVVLAPTGDIEIGGTTTENVVGATNTFLFTFVAEVNGQGYATIQAAVDAAAAGDTVTIISDVSDEAVEVNKNLTITGNVTLTNVSINAVEGADELTVSGLSFIGNSWINSGAAGKLTVSGVKANVTPNNTTYTNSRSAFISLGRSEGKALELTVENSEIVAVSGTNAVLGWAKITKATITGNTFGSETVYQNSGDVVKFMSIADGATLTFTGNTAYSNYNGFVLAQNTTRANSYTAIFEANEFHGGADHVWIEVSGSNTCNGSINLKSDNTINGNAVTASDIKLHPNLNTFTGYAGVDVVLNEEGKVIGGAMQYVADDVIADGYELSEDKTIVEAPTFVATVNGQGYETLAEAIAAAKDGEVVEILAGEYILDESFTIDKAITVKGAGKAETKLVFDLATSAFVIASSNVTFSDMTVEQGVKDNSFHISISKGASNAPKIQYSNVTIKNIDFVGGDYSLCLIGEDVVVDGCSFINQDSHNVIIYSLKGDSKIINNTFGASKGSNKSAILWEGGADNATDLSGFVGGGNLTISGNTAQNKGVFFQFTSWGLVENVELVISENAVDGTTNKVIALYDNDGATPSSGNEFSTVTVTENAFTNTKAGRPILKEYTGKIAVDVSANYLGSESPDVATLLVGAKVKTESYYATYEDGTFGELVEIKKPAASVNGTEYTTIEEAIAAVKAGGTLTLLSDVELCGIISLPTNVTITIDGNGFKMTPASNFTTNGNGAALVVADGDTAYHATNNYVIKNLTFEGFEGLTRVLRANFANVTVENCKFVNNKVSEGVITSSYAAIDINNCEFTANESAFSILNVGFDVSAGTELVANITDSSFVANRGAIAIAYFASSANVTGNLWSDNVHTGSNANGAAILAGPYTGSVDYAINVNDNAFVNAITNGTTTVPAVFAEDWSQISGKHTAFDLGSNYWGGALPEAGVAYQVSGNNPTIELDSYYATYEDGSFGELVEIKKPAASVNGTEYATLGEAIAALGDGETLVILQGFTADANMFIELNGKKNVTITAADGVVIEGNISIGYHASHIDQTDRTNSTLTIKGLTVNGTLTVCSNDKNFVVAENKAAQITVKTYREGMNVEITDNVADGAMGTAANSYGMFFTPNATAYNLTVSNNTFKNVNSHAFVVQGCGDGAAVTYAESITVTENTFESWGTGGKSDRAAFKIWADTKYAPTTGSDVNETTNAMRELAQAIAAGGNVYNSTAQNTVQVDVYGIATDLGEIPAPVYETFVAEVDGVQYTSLQAAVDAANGDTVTLISDVALTETLVVNGTVTLDLAGYTVSMVYTENAGANHEMILNKGNLTVTGNGTLSYEYKGASLGTTYAANTITGYFGSVLTIVNGTIENLTYDSAVIAYAIDGRTYGNAAVTVNVEGGTITSKRQAIRIFANATNATGILNISGGDITGRVIIQSANTSANKAELNITGGTFTPNAYKTDVLYVGGSTGANMSINANVSGGTFKGVINSSVANGFITGGKFTTPITSDTCNSGYVVAKSADGIYTAVRDYVTNIGAGLRYLNASATSVDIRFSYTFAPEFSFEGAKWGWYITANNSIKLEGENYDSDNKTNFVLTGVAPENYAVDISAQIYYIVEIDGVEYEVVGRTVTTNILKVSDWVTKNSKKPGAIAYATDVLAAYDEYVANQPVALVKREEEAA